MLTSFFGNSKSINYILLAAALPLVLGLRYWIVVSHLPNFIQAGALIGQCGLLIFSMLLLDFVIRKNKLTQPNTYGLWWFFCGIIAGVEPGNFLQALVLTLSLLSLRRIMSLTNEQNLEKKIFDAALWIFIVSVFYPWFLWMILALYMAVAQLNPIAWRHYLIPLFSALSLWLIYAGSTALFPEIGAAIQGGDALVRIELEPLNWSWPQPIWLQSGLAAGVILLVTTLVRLPLAYKEGTTMRQGHFQWVWRVLIMVLVLAGFSVDQKTEVFLWLVLPLSSILYANSLELKQPSLLREFLAFLPLAMPLAQLLLK